MKTNKSILIIILVILSQFKFYAQELYDSSDLYYYEAKKNISEQNYTRAAKMSWRGLQLAPNDLDLKVFLGKANMELGRYDTARYVLKQVYDIRKKDIDVLGYLATIEQTTKRYSDAICFVNELLEISPYNKGLWRRKIFIYKEMGNIEEAERALKRLYQIYPNDSEIQSDYNYIMLNDGNKAIDKKNYDDGSEIYKNVINNDPTNKSAYMGLIRIEMLKSNPENALQFTNRALEVLKEDKDLIRKKISLLEQLGKYPEAIVYISNEVDKILFPEIHSKILPYLLQKSAYFNENNDPYEINKKLLIENGYSNSQNYVIKKAMGQGYDGDAEYFLKKGIKRNPNDKKLQVQLKELYRPIKDKERFEKEVIKLYKKYPNDTDIANDYNLIMYKRAKTYVQNRQFDEALEIFKDLASSPDFSKGAEQQIFGIYLELGQFDRAEEQIDKLLVLEPDNPNYLLRKSFLYTKMEFYEDALNITRALEQTYPLSEKYPRIFVDQTLEYARHLIKIQHYDRALDAIEGGLKRQNYNKELLNLAINASSAIPDYPKGINYCRSAISFYPNNKNFKIKLSSLLAQDKQYDEAISTLDSLKIIYKYDRNIKNSLAEVLWYRARDNEDEGNINEALADYNLSDSLNHSEKYSLQRMINLSIIKKTNEESLKIIDEKIEKYPNDNFLKYKKGLVFELLKQYDSAYYYQQFREIDDPFEKQEWNLILEKLKAKSLKNILAATYSEAISDSITFSTSLTSLTFNRKYKDKNTFGAEVNYASRRSEFGFQGGLNYSRIFNHHLYADVGVLFGSQFFPKFISYTNAYKELGKGYQAQIGFRYAFLQNDVSFFTLNLGTSKTFENIWLKAKVSLMRDDAFNYFNSVGQTRINVNTKGDYLSFIGSFGSAPFNEQLPEGATAFLDFSNLLLGAGYAYNISTNTMILVNGSWIRFKNPAKDSNSLLFINQYNLEVTMNIKF